MAKTNMPHNPLEGERPELTLDLESNSDEQVSIVIVHKDRPEYLNICLQSIAVTSMNNNYEIIVVDNNSGSDSQDFLDDIKGEVMVVKNKENLFWSAAANKGAGEGKQEVQVFCLSALRRGNNKSCLVGFNDQCFRVFRLRIGWP